MSGALAPVAQPSSAPPTAFANIPADDPDMLALQQVQALIAEPQDQPAPPAPPAPVPSDAAAEATPPDAPPAPGPVPYQRFAEVLRQLQQVKEHAAYLEGRAEALTATVPGTDTPAAPAPVPTGPSPAEIVQAAQDEIKAAAAAWEGGEFGVVELEERRFAGMAKILGVWMQAIRQGVLGEVQQMVEQSAARPGLLDAQAIAMATAQLEQKHRWVGVMSDPQLQTLERIARQEAEGFGQPYGTGPADLLRLRTRVAQLADKYGPDWHPNTTLPPAPAGSPAAATPPTPTGIRPTAEDTRRALAMAAAHPPNEPAGRGSGEAVLTLERLQAMSPQEREAVPSAQIKRLLGLPPE